MTRKIYGIGSLTARAPFNNVRGCIDRTTFFAEMTVMFNAAYSEAVDLALRKRFLVRSPCDKSIVAEILPREGLNTKRCTTAGFMKGTATKELCIKFTDNPYSHCCSPTTFL